MTTTGSSRRTGARWTRRVFINGGDAFNLGGALGVDKSQEWLAAIPSNERDNLESMAIIDINGDQFPDLYLGHSGINYAWINVDGTHFEVAQSDAIPPGPFNNESGYSTQWLLAADFDDDGDTDIVDLISGRNRYHERDGANGYFDVTADSMPDTSQTSRGGDIGDIDQDGLPDIYIANNAQDEIFVSTGAGFADVSVGLPFMPHDSYGARLWDFDNDCDLDVYVVNSNDQDRVYINTLDPPCP